MATPICFMFALGNSVSAQKKTPDAQTPQRLCSYPTTIPKHSASCFRYFYDLHIAAFFARFSKNVVPIRDSSKKQASQILTCRAGLGEALYNIRRPRRGTRLRGFFMQYCYPCSLGLSSHCLCPSLSFQSCYPCTVVMLLSCSLFLPMPTLFCYQ